MGEQPESALHSNPSLDKKEGNHPSDVHEKVVLIFLMVNATNMLKILLVMFLKEISAYIYMMCKF